MMRFSIPPNLVPKLRELQAQSKQRYTDKIVESEDAVVMTLGLGDAMYLTFDGRVIVDEWNYPEEDQPPREAKDAKEMFMAVVIGAKRFKAQELLSILPPRAETAVDCAACERSGWVRFGQDVEGKPVDFVCPECGGVGWTDNNLK